MPTRKILKQDKTQVAKRKIRCAIVEDQVMFEEMLRTLLNAQGLFEVVGVAHTAAEGIALCETLRPELLILDLELPDGQGFPVAQRLAELCPESHTIIVSGHARNFKCPADMRKSVYSVVHKTDGLETLLREAIQFQRTTSRIDPTVVAPLDPETLLTGREMEVFRLIGEGLGTKEIAERLGSAFLTIETHRRNISAKLGANRGDLVKMAALHNQVAGLRSS